MPQPRIIGPSHTVPGAVDVDDGYGGVFQADPSTPALQELAAMPPEPMGGAGASAPIANADLGAEARANAQQFADAQPSGPAPMATDAPSGFAATVMPPEARPASRAELAPEAQQQLGQIEAASRMQRAGATPGPAYQPPAAQQAAQQQTAIGAPIFAGGGGGGPRRTETLTAERPAGPLSEQTTQRLTETGEALERARMATAETEAVGLERLASAQQNYRDQLRQAEADRLDLQRRQQAAARDQRQRIQSLQDQVRGKQIDPERIWAPESEGGAGRSRVFAVLGAALGAFGAALTGTRNFAMDIIQQQIDADIDAQKTNLSNLRQGISDERSVLGDMMAEFGDEEQAIEATKIAKREELSSYLTEIANETQSDGVRARAMEIKAELDAQNAQGAAQMEQRAMGTVTIEQTQRFGGGGRRQLVPVRFQSGAVTYYDPTNPRDAIAIDEALRAGGQVAAADEQGLRRLSEAESGFSRELTALRAVERAAQGGDIPGVGRLEGRMPDALVGAEGRRVRRDVRNATVGILRRTTGSAYTPEELSQELAARGITQESSEEEFLDGVRSVIREAEAHMQTVSAGESEATVQEYERRRGQGGGSRASSRGAPVRR